MVEYLRPHLVRRSSCDSGCLPRRQFWKLVVHQGHLILGVVGSIGIAGLFCGVLLPAAMLFSMAVRFCFSTAISCSFSRALFRCIGLFPELVQLHLLQHVAQFVQAKLREVDGINLGCHRIPH